MATKRTKSVKGFYLDLPTDLIEGMRELAERNGRSLQVEGEHALRRHLASPPEVVTPPLVDGPELVPAKRLRGRPRNTTPEPAEDFQANGSSN